MSNLIKFSPFGQAGRLHSVIDELFNRNLGEFLGGDFATNAPAVNVRETDQSYILELGAPGLQKEDFKVSVDKNQLTISAERQESKEENTDKFLRKEFSYSQFKRSFTLPEHVSADQIQAKYEQGVLQLTLPKKDDKPAAGRVISID